MNGLSVSWRQHCRSPFAQYFAFPSIPHLWWNQKLSRCRLSNVGHQTTLNMLHWLWGWNLKLFFWETQLCRKKARVQDQETSHNHKKTDGNYLYVRVLKSAYNKCVTTSPPVCTKKNITKHTCHQEKQSSSGPLYVPRLVVAPKRTCLKQQPCSTARNRPHVGVDAPEPPEQVASLSTAPPLTNLWTSAWPADRLSKHDTDRKTVGKRRKGGRQGGVRWEKDRRWGKWARLVRW